jgi:hypothetical protein
MVMVLVGAEFPICTESTNHQYYPSAFFANGQYYAFWADARYYGTNSTYCLYSARVTTAGTVLDPDGKLCFRDSCIAKPAISFDGTNFLVSFRNGC